MKKEWSTPNLETIGVEQTMASAWWGPHDGAYQEGEDNNIPHHGS